MFRGLSFRARCALATLMLAALPACEETPPPKDPSSQIDPAEQAKIKKSRQKIDAANEAADTKKYDDARKLLREAQELGVESHKFEISEVLEKVDKRQAKLWANEAHDLFEAKKCEEAFAKLAEQINDLDSETFTREVRRLAGDEGQKCASGAVDELMTAGKFAEARAFANAAPTKAVLGPGDAKKLATELDLVIVEALKGQVAEPIKAKKWDEAVGKIDAAVKANHATEEIAAQVLAVVREAAAPELAAQAGRAVGQADAKKQLGLVDATMKLLKWELTSPEGVAPPKEKAAPEDLARKRDGLATWVEAARLNIKMGKRPEKKYLHGKYAVLPAMKIDAPSKRDLEAGSEVWLLGVSKDKALVADSDPGTFVLSAQFERAIGWVPFDRLMKDPTAEWLPPNDQLKDEQVWAPLGTDDLLWLGKVTEVKGKEISVQSLADSSKVAKFTRDKLRAGKLAVGLKLVAQCKDPKKVVTLDEIVPPGRSVRLNCEGTEGIKEEVLENLRTKVDLLPASK